VDKDCASYQPAVKMVSSSTNCTI